MTIEQRPELNRYVDPSIPLTWVYRWRQFKIILPVWVFICVVMIESALYRAWLSNKLNPDVCLAVAGGCLFIPSILFGGIELQIRIRQRSKRTIQFTEKRIAIQPARNRFVRWERISKFQFEPVAGAPGLTKLNLFLSGQTLPRPIWSMLLESSQKQELLRYIQTKKTETPTNYEVEVLERPRQPERGIPYPLFGVSLYLGGLFCMLHGLPLLLGALGSGQHGSNGDSKLTAEESAKLRHFIASHFSSREEFHHFFLTLSIVLIVAGIILMILGRRSMKRRTQVTPVSGSA